MSLLNSGHLVWWLRRRVAEEPDPTTRAELRLAVDRAALELWSENDEVRVRAIAALLEMAALYDDHPGYLNEWRR